jgi:hypothetical protein
MMTIEGALADFNFIQLGLTLLGTYLITKFTTSPAGGKNLK